MVQSAGREYRPLLLGLVAIITLAVLFRSGLLLIVAILLGLTGAAVAVWGRYAIVRLSYTRSFARSRIFYGESVELTVELTNRKLLPVTYLKVNEILPEELAVQARSLQFRRVGKAVLQLLFNLGWYQKVVRHYQVTPSRRGYFRLGPAEVEGGDPFGYLVHSFTVTDPVELIVYPRISPLEQLGIPSRRPFGDLKSRNRLFEDPMRFAGVREYQPGDPMNRVHWKAFAASGQLQVKLLDPSSNLGLALFLNMWSYEPYWQGTDANYLETACTVAGSIAHWATGNDVAVGLCSNGPVQSWGLNLRLPPAHGPEVLTTVLEGLARLALPSRLPMADLLIAEATKLSYGTSVVVITRMVSEELAGAIFKVQHSGRPVTLILVGDDEGAVPRLPGVRLYRVSGEEALHAAVFA